MYQDHLTLLLWKIKGVTFLRTSQMMMLLQNYSRILKRILTWLECSIRSFIAFWLWASSGVSGFISSSSQWEVQIYFSLYAPTLHTFYSGTLKVPKTLSSCISPVPIPTWRWRRNWKVIATPDASQQSSGAGLGDSSLSPYGKWCWGQRWQCSFSRWLNHRFTFRVLSYKWVAMGAFICASLIRA